MTKRNNESGIALPFVMGAVLIFSMLIILLSSIAIISINHSRNALYRTQALAAAEAGAQDYVNRMNAFAAFDSWTAERSREARLRNLPASNKFPKIVRDSALAKWTNVEGASNAQYTYDVIGNNAGLIIRSTGRSGPNKSVVRSIEYRITRNSDSEVAYVATKGYAHVDAYAQQMKLFKSVTYEQGLMGVFLNTKYRWDLSDYKKFCGDEKTAKWYMCWRPYKGGADRVDGNFITAAPFTIHGPKSFLYPARSVNPQIMKYPTISGSITIINGSPDEFTHPAGFRYNSNTGTTYWDFYTDQFATEYAGRKKYEYLPFDETIGSPPANYTVIRSEERTFDSCRFKGSTQVILHGDDLWVRSPHTPATVNNDKNDWCKNKTPLLRGRTKRSAGPDITQRMIQSGDYLQPANPSTWVKFDDVPTDAVFLVERTGTEGCDTSIVGNEASIGKSTGLGFPGTTPTVSTAEPGQERLYDCRNGDLFIEGAVSYRRTFAAEDNVYLTGGIRYSDRDDSTGELPVNSDDFLGLVARRNVVVYNPGTRNKEPRTPYSLPTREQDFNYTSQGPFTSDWNNWRKGIGKVGPYMKDPTKGRASSKPGWLVLPQYDAAIVAEEGSFHLENMNALQDRPARMGRGDNDTPLKVVVSGSVFSKYAPSFHYDRIPTRGNSNDGRAHNRDNSRLEVYGLNEHFIFDKRFSKRLPPGFSGHSDSAYRITGFAEVFSNHLQALD